MSGWGRKADGPVWGLGQSIVDVRPQPVLLSQNPEQTRFITHEALDISQSLMFWLSRQNLYGSSNDAF